MLARFRKNENDEGFTLIELMIAIVIIGILAAVAVPIYLKQKRAAQDASLKADLRQMAQVQEAVIADLLTLNNFPTYGIYGETTASSRTTLLPDPSYGYTTSKYVSSKGNNVKAVGMDAGTDGPSAGYCIEAYSDNGTKFSDGGRKYWVWKSYSGGLQAPSRSGCPLGLS